MKYKILSIVLSLMVAATFIPMTGDAAFAEELQGSFSASAKVTGLVQSSASFKSVTIKWNEFSGADGYEVYRADKKSGKYKKIKTLKKCVYRDKGNKKLGKKKYYKVRAYKTVNSAKVYSKYSSIISAKPKLKAPAKVTSSGGYGKVTIKWSSVPGAKKYQVYRATSKNGKYKLAFTTSKKRYNNTTVTNGKKYFYKVRGFRKTNGKKRYGKFSKPIEGMAKLNGAGNLKVTLGSNGTVTGTWSKVPGAGGYQLQRARTENGTYATVAETVAPKALNKVTASGQYYYRVRAFSIVNGKRQYGSYSAGGRTNAVNQARSWVGCKESNGSHRKIIRVFNNYGPDCGAISYSTSWCAAFVSAVAIKTNNASIIPIDCYCPRMLANFSKKTRNKKYIPKAGDVVFYDWNWNKVPDHVGMIESVSGNSITAIEGNYSDRVKRRTFKKGYSLLLAYGLPSYSISNVVSYTAPAAKASGDPIVAKAMVTNEDIEAACEEITAAGELTEPVEYIEEAEPDTAAAEPEATEAAEPETSAEPETAITEPVAEPETEAVEDVSEEISVEEALIDIAPIEEEASEAEPETEAEAAETEAEPSEPETVAETEAAETEEMTEPEEAIEETENETEIETEAAEPSEPETEVETAEKIIEYIQEEEPAADVAAAEDEYNAFLVYGICDEMDIDACVVTVTEEDGSECSYNEVVLDGELYILNATEDGGVLEKFVPEEIN